MFDRLANGKGCLLMLKGVVSDLPPELQAEVHATAAKLRAVLAEGGPLATVALALVSLENAE